MDAFRRGGCDEFSTSGPAIGRVLKVQLRCSGGGHGGWLLDHMEVTCARPAATTAPVVDDAQGELGTGGVEISVWMFSGN